MNDDISYSNCIPIAFFNVTVVLVIFYTEILMRKVVLLSFLMSERSEKIHNSTFFVLIMLAFSVDYTKHRKISYDKKHFQIIPLLKKHQSKYLGNQIEFNIFHQSINRRSGSVPRLSRIFDFQNLFFPH